MRRGEDIPFNAKKRTIRQGGKTERVKRGIAKKKKKMPRSRGQLKVSKKKETQPEMTRPCRKRRKRKEKKEKGKNLHGQERTHITSPEKKREAEGQRQTPSNTQGAEERGGGGNYLRYLRREGNDLFRRRKEANRELDRSIPRSGKRGEKKEGKIRPPAVQRR